MASLILPRPSVFARVGVVATVMLVCFGMRVGSSAADTVLASGLPQAPKVSEYGQTLAWSTYDPAISAWRLMVRSGGIIQALAVSPSPTPFDVDLGDDGHGGLVATYSRCSRPSETAVLARGCRLFVYAFASGLERPIAVANMPGASQFLPSMAAGRVAFARILEGRPAGRANTPRIYVQRLAGGPPRLLPGGSEDGDPGTGPTSLDLSATALAFSWESRGSVGILYPDGTAELRLDGLFGGQTTIDLQGEETIEKIADLSPTLVGGAVFYGVAMEGDETEYQLRSFGLPSARRGLAKAPAGLASTASGSAGTLYSRCIEPAGEMPQSSSSCEVALAPTVSYGDPDRQLAHAGRPTTIAAYRGNWLAFSAYDQAEGIYRLMLRRPDGSLVAAPVPPRRVPFDVEIGPRSGGGEAGSGGLTAVYSRCGIEPKLDPRDLLPLPSTGRGCRIYSYELGAPHERLIPGSGSRYLPSLWDGELAFVREDLGGRAQVFLGSLDGRTAPRLLPGGPLGAGLGLGPRALVLRKGSVAFVWEYRVGGSLHSQLRLDRSVAGPTVLGETSSPSGEDRELSPSFTSAGALSWARREAGGHSWMFVLGSGQEHPADYLLPDPVEALASLQLSSEGELSGTILYARGDDHGGSTIRRMAGPPAVAGQR